MISWKQPFERLNEEFEMTKKKKQALDDLLNAGKISQSTYNSFNEKIDETVAEIEKKQKELLEKMNSKAKELDEHIKTLEMLLAKFEIRRVTGEVEEEVYQREVDLLSTGLETARQELDTVKEGVDELSSSLPIETTDITETQKTEITEEVETPQAETEYSEETPQVVTIEQTSEKVAEQTLPEPPVETTEGGETETSQKTEETQETWHDTEETEEEQSSEEETQSMGEETEETMDKEEEDKQEEWQSTGDTQETAEDLEEETQPMETVFEGE